MKSRVSSSRWTAISSSTSWSIGIRHSHDRSDRLTRPQDLGHAGGKGAPGTGFGCQLRAARPGQPVELRSAAELGRAPFRLDPAAAFEPVERGVERPFFDQDRFLASVFDEPGDRVPMARAALGVS